MTPLTPTPARLPAPSLPADAQPPANQPHAPDAHAGPTPPTGRHDGWTPDRQRTFVEGIAGGDTVEQACRRVALTVSSAYALRRRANGAAFALAWDGARLLAREALADTLLTRALEGQEETITRADGSTVTRYRHDNRLAQHMLHRLDRFADAASASAHGTAARLVAGEFDAFLDLLGTHAAPARAGLFLGTRLAPDTLDGENTAHADLAPVLALARADRYLRTRAAHAAEVPVADLDPAGRAQWSAEQWTRAEAAGLVALAPPPPPAQSACEPPLPPLRPDLPDYVSPADRPDPVWWCDDADAWRTRFPPPDFFMGEEDGEWGDPDYQRELDDDEIEQLERPHRIQSAVRHVTEGRARDAWFADAARVADFDDEQPDTPEPALSEDDAQPATEIPSPLAAYPRDAAAAPSPDGHASTIPVVSDADARTAAPRSDARDIATDAATRADARTNETPAANNPDPPATESHAATRPDAPAFATPSSDPSSTRPHPRRRRAREQLPTSPVVAASTVRGSDYHGLQAT